MIGITGSAGKSTTTALVGEIAKLHYQQRKPNNRAWVGGNIGNPLIQYLDQMKEDDIAVMELSSFQLEIMTRSPHIAVILNLTPNHLDRHKTMAAYTSAKSNILTHQGPDDIAILNRDDTQSRKIYNEIKGRLITFGVNEPHNKQEATFYKRGKLYLQASGQIAKIIKADQINLPGTHNLYNILAAIAISAAASFSMQAIYEVLSTSPASRTAWNLSGNGAGLTGTTTQSPLHRNGPSQPSTPSTGRSFCWPAGGIKTCLGQIRPPRPSKSGPPGSLW